MICRQILSDASFSVELPAEYVEKWKHLSPRAELRLPTSNEYIATDFSLKTVNPLLAKEVIVTQLEAVL